MEFYFPLSPHRRRPNTIVFFEFLSAALKDLNIVSLMSQSTESCVIWGWKLFFSFHLNPDEI